MLDTYIATAPVAATRGRGQNRKRKKNSKRPTETGQEVGVRVASPDWFQFMGMVPVDISCVLRAPFSQSALFFFKIDRWRLRLHCPPSSFWRPYSQTCNGLTVTVAWFALGRSCFRSPFLARPLAALFSSVSFFCTFQPLVRSTTNLA